MKKLALVLAVLVAFTGASLFAEVSVGVFSAGSLGLMSSVDAGAIEDVQSVGPNWAGGAYMGLGFKASNDNMGFSFGFDLGTDDSFDFNGTNDIVRVDYLSGYYMFLDGMVKVELGNVEDGSYRLADYVYWDAIGDGFDYFGGDSQNDKYADALGAAVTIKPMDAFSLSVFVPVEDNKNFVDQFLNTNIALSYMIPDTATIMVQAHLTADDASTDAYSQIWAGVDVTAVENLGLRVTYTNTPSANTIGLYANYGMDAITIAEDFILEIPSSGDMDITSQTMVAYGMDIATVGLKANINYVSDLSWGVAPYAEKFMGNGLIGAAFNLGQAAGATDISWELPVYYKLWF